MTLTDVVNDNTSEESEVESPETPDSPDNRSRKHRSFTLKGSVVGTFIQHRLSEDRDVKIIITSKGSSTGLGKTTLAILICRWVEEHLAGRLWQVENRGFVNVQKYIKAYKNEKPYSGLLIDEIEHGADSRRAMSKDNVGLSHAWATLRYRNMVSVATLPSISMLDKRMLELADIWINVVDKGKAIPFWIDVNDFTGKVKRYTVKHPLTAQQELIFWPDLAGDTDYSYMKKTKDQNVRTGESEQMYEWEDVEKNMKKAQKEKRDELIKSFYESEHTNISQAKLGEIVGLSQSSIDVIVNDKR